MNQPDSLEDDFSQRCDMYEDASDTSRELLPEPPLTYLAAAAQRGKVMPPRNLAKGSKEMPPRNLEKGSKETKEQKQQDNNKKDEITKTNNTNKEQPASQRYNPAQFNISTPTTVLQKLRSRKLAKHQKTSHPTIYLEAIPNPAYNPVRTKQRSPKWNTKKYYTVCGLIRNYILSDWKHRHRSSKVQDARYHRKAIEMKDTNEEDTENSMGAHIGEYKKIKGVGASIWSEERGGIETSRDWIKW